MFVALRPGSVLLIDMSSRKPLSSSHFFLVTNALRRYATTPPPKLVAPMIRNVMKISAGDTFLLGAAGVVTTSDLQRRRATPAHSERSSRT